LIATESQQCVPFARFLFVVPCFLAYANLYICCTEDDQGKRVNDVTQGIFLNKIGNDMKYFNYVPCNILWAVCCLYYKTPEVLHYHVTFNVLVQCKTRTKKELLHEFVHLFIFSKVSKKQKKFQLTFTCVMFVYLFCQGKTTDCCTLNAWTSQPISTYTNIMLAIKYTFFPGLKHRT
jgi:hypothetical protein